MTNHDDEYPTMKIGSRVLLDWNDGRTWADRDGECHWQILSKSTMAISRAVSVLECYAPLDAHANKRTCETRGFVLRADGTYCATVSAHYETTKGFVDMDDVAARGITDRDGIVSVRFNDAFKDLFDEMDCPDFYEGRPVSNAG